MGDDILDSVLDLEDVSYREGYEEGRVDGARAGHEEGTIFGLEQGYQKASEMGKLHGRAMMLNACLSDSTANPATAIGQPADPQTEQEEVNLPARPPINLPTIPDNPRLKKHIDTLLNLTDPATLSFQNSDEAVEAFDERMKKAVAKAKVIDKLIAEPYNLSVSGPVGEAATAEQMPFQHSVGRTANIEELGTTAVRR